MNNSRSKQLLPVIISAIGWFALFAQFYLIILNRTTSIPETIIRYFTFFTILTNIMVVVWCTLLMLNAPLVKAKFVSSQRTAAALAVYISVVGIIYNTILRFLWQPEGLQLMVDELLHTIIPLLLIFYWILFVPKDQLKWKNVLPWLLYPLAYSILIIIRGYFSGYYPYPFIDAGVLGYNKVLLNSAGLTTVFLLISLMFIATGKLMSRNKKGTEELKN